ncbi:MAG: hypothetical protein LBR38_00105 [Synergistaceae bacterium]|nr:hypothetical protein [Synergistaceae bacterium]
MRKMLSLIPAGLAVGIAVGIALILCAPASANPVPYAVGPYAAPYAGQYAAPYAGPVYYQPVGQVMAPSYVAAPPAYSVSPYSVYYLSPRPVRKRRREPEVRYVPSYTCPYHP